MIRKVLYSSTLPDGSGIALVLEVTPAPVPVEPAPPHEVPTLPAIPEPPVVVAPIPPAPPPVITPEPPVVPSIPPVVTPEPPVVVPPPTPEPPPLPPRVWQLPPPLVLPTLPAGAKWEGPITLKPGEIVEGRYFLNDTDAPLFKLPYDKEIVTIRKNTCISRGHILSGYRARAHVHDNSFEVTAPLTKGRAPALLGDLPEIMHLDLHHNDVRGVGRGIYVTGYSNNHPKARQFVGDVSKGDRLKVYRNRLHNPDGRISDGAGGRVRSLWVSTHGNNEKRKAIGGEIGRQVSNYLQVNELLGAPGLIEWNCCTADLGYTVEDGLSVLNSSGLPNDPLIVQDNWIWNTGGPDPDYVPGISKSYNGSNKVISNPTSPQDPTQTGYSGTCGLTEGGDDKYDRNPAHVIWRRNWGAGYRAIFSQQGGHHTEWDGNRLYLCDRHIDGVPWSGGYEAWFQFTDYRKGKKATDNGLPIYSEIKFNNQAVYAGTVEQPLPLPEALKNGIGSGSGNVKRTQVKDGGRAALMEWWALAHEGGQTVGRRAS